MTTAQQLALWADKLRDLSAMGLLFSKNVHDETAFRTVQTIAMEMLAAATGQGTEQLEPLRASLFARPTPLSSGEGALFDRQGRILLIQRADSGKWAIPGGAFEVGETPVEAVVREVFEETGIHCRVTGLVGVFDSRLSGTVSPHHLYHFVFLCEPLDAPVEKPLHAGVETLAQRWFAQNEVPADLQPGHAPRISHAFRAAQGDRRAFFDGAGLL